jgi:hypothetical protein
MNPDPHRLTHSRLAVILLGVLIVVAMIAALLPQLSKDGIPRSLPATASLEDSYDRSGFMYASHSYCFRVTDDQLLNLLIDRWKLTRVKDLSSSAISFTATANGSPQWWPSEQSLSTFPEQYRHEERHRYWSVWVDREHSRLWAETGRL